jgi:hypothetical protein
VKRGGRGRRPKRPSVKDWKHYGPNAVLLRFAERVGDEAFARACAISRELERRPPAGAAHQVDRPRFVIRVAGR